MLQFRLGATCYLVGSIGTQSKVYCNNVELVELDDFDSEDCGYWRYLTFEDGKDLITINIDEYEDVDELISDINKFSGSSIDELQKFLKKERIDFIKCPH